MEGIALTETTYYILLALHSPNHGYGIMQSVQEMSHGRVHLAAGTLYGALTSMQEKRWIVLLPKEDGSRKKAYKLTDTGKEVLRTEVKRLKELYDNGRKVIENE